LKNVGEAFPKETTQHFQGVTVFVGLSPGRDATLVLHANQPTICSIESDGE
jgi:hypothetical protein